MITIIIFMTILASYVLFHKKEWGSEWVGGLALSLVIGVLIGTLVALCIPAKTEPTTYVADIECINDDSGIRGRFYLCSGRINETMIYNFYYKTNKGGFKLLQVDVDKTSIYYSNKKPSYEYIVDERVDGSLLNYFSLGGYHEEGYYNIYIPKGSIKTDFVLDAQ